MDFMIYQKQDSKRLIRLLSHENQLREKGLKAIAGCDESGRGPLAGPVIAAAVIFPEGVCLTGVNDSKKLSPVRRETLFDAICEHALAVGTGRVDPEEIDRINILKATQKAMHQALHALEVRPDYLLVDGYPLPGAPCPQEAIIGGDGHCFSIAAASIIAKVTRDRIMISMDREYPGYGFASHKGYGTRAHIEAIQKKGPTPIHRRSFRIKPWGS
jgi:ribonuclease HII